MTFIAPPPSILLGDTRYKVGLYDENKETEYTNLKKVDQLHVYYWMSHNQMNIYLTFVNPRRRRGVRPERSGQGDV